MEEENRKKLSLERRKESYELFRDITGKFRDDEMRIKYEKICDELQKMQKGKKNI